MRRGLLLICTAALLLACGSSDSGGNATGGPTGTGTCVGQGWRDTCFWSMTCSKGRYELFCSDTNDPDLDQAVMDAGITLDGSNCACVVDQMRAAEVSFADSFCSNNFDSMDPDRHDKARAVVNGICSWTTP